MFDGQNDYSRYTRNQIFDALRHIDRARYPLNAAKLESTLANLPEELPLDTSAAVKRPRSRKRLWILAGLIVLIAAAVVSAIFILKSRSDAAIAAAVTKFVSANAVAVQALGAPVTGGVFRREGAPDKDGVQQFSMDVAGAKAKGVLTGDISRDGKDWQVKKSKLTLAGKPESIDLTAGNTP